MQAFEPKPFRKILKFQILCKKREMIDLGMKYGLTDQRTIQCSQQLDYLLNLYSKENKLEPTG
ncbi:aspartyl-phosphate phosphatase Spo0E family protein [Lentibacillus sp. CBA3610]|uniref:aspartyl-phosphate phosphatase Spo0E family protein n=1 Tax=Lentibacillus sp. CBA3610 TaxID=2518176 RepID=UPI00159507B7|nr:aspartyl-phosphate phosphatase Spo0E family protein [Lentibacillus sp. CBA3610]QKY68383.1 aspartyl-phosphate phosphatase Spo0E family protein [Lentibacillus sp. CBA3610]